MMYKFIQVAMQIETNAIGNSFQQVILDEHVHIKLFRKGIVVYKDPTRIALLLDLFNKLILCKWLVSAFNIPSFTDKDMGMPKFSNMALVNVWQLPLYGNLWIFAYSSYV